MDITAEEFNKKYPIGTPVKCWPGFRTVDGVPGNPELGALQTRTRSEAWEMPSGQHVVKVEGRSGGIWLHNVEIDMERVTEAFVRETQAQDKIVQIGKGIQDGLGAILRSLEPYYTPYTTCDGKCAKVEDLEEELTKANAEIEQLKEALTSAQRRASEWQTRGEAAEAAHLSVLEQRTDDHAEIERLQGALRLNNLRLERERDNLTVFRGVIGQKEQELAEAEERISNLTRLVESVSASEQNAKISSLQDMLSTQHAKLVKAEGDLSIARQETDIARQDLADAQEERETVYSMLDPNTEVDDRTKSLAELVQDLVTENQRLEREAREQPHKGCKQLEAKLQKDLRDMTVSRNAAIHRLNELRSDVLKIVQTNVVNKDDA